MEDCGLDVWMLLTHKWPYEETFRDVDPFVEQHLSPFSAYVVYGLKLLCSNQEKHLLDSPSLPPKKAKKNFSTSW